MYFNKSELRDKTTEVVHFSDKQTFYYQDILFRIFRTGSTNPKAPILALLKVDTQERVSGLFKIGTDIYQGDTRSKKEGVKKKEYFRLRFLDKNTIELTNFENALIYGGYVTPVEQNDPLIEHYRGLESGAYSHQLNITSEPIN